jgi:hypothetical protein
VCGGRVYGMWGPEPIPTGTYSRDSLTTASQCQDAQVSEDKLEIIGLVDLYHLGIEDYFYALVLQAGHLDFNLGGHCITIERV